MPYRRYSRLNPQRYYTALTTKLGRRGTVLCLLGLLWLLQGMAILSEEATTPYVLFDIFDLQRAIVWIVTGAIALASARHPPGSDVVGFISLYIMAAYNVLGYLVGFITWIVPDGNDGAPQGFLGAIFWTVVLVLIVVVSGWEENAKEEDV